MTESFFPPAFGFGYTVGAGAGLLDAMTQRTLDTLRRTDRVVHDRRAGTSPQPDHHAS